MFPGGLFMPLATPQPILTVGHSHNSELEGEQGISRHTHFPNIQTKVLVSV